MEKDYSLLRPFDLEAAKAGAAICITDGEVVTYVGAFGNGAIGYDLANGSCGIRAQSLLYMAPLCWVEGKPVYRGDVLYSSFFRKHRCDRNNATGQFVAGGFDYEQLYKQDDCEFKTKPESCTWTPPKVKREGWVNVYGIGYMTNLYESKKEADESASDKRKACIRIEWEE